MRESRSGKGETTPMSRVGIVEALAVAAAIDLAFKVWAIGRAIRRRPVPEGILWRKRP